MYLKWQIDIREEIRWFHEFAQLSKTLALKTEEGPKIGWK